jgi:hypothetical protein
MKYFLMLSIILMLTGCGKTTLTEEGLESFFREHKVGSDYPVALKKHSITESYLATIHGYPDNLSVCEQVIEPYNKNQKLSDIEGTYYCEVLR